MIQSIMGAEESPLQVLAQLDKRFFRHILYPNGDNKTGRSSEIIIYFKVTESILSISVEHRKCMFLLPFLMWKATSNTTVQ